MTFEEKNNYAMRQEILQIYEILKPQTGYSDKYIKSILDKNFTTECLLEGVEDEVLNTRDTPIICHAKFGEDGGAKKGIVITERYLISCSKEKKEFIPFNSISNIKIDSVSGYQLNKIIIEYLFQKKPHFIELEQIAFYSGENFNLFAILIYSIIKFSNRSVALIVEDNIFDGNAADSKIELYIKNREKLQEEKIKRIIDEINLDDELDIMEKIQKIKRLECFGYIIEKQLQYLNYRVENKDMVQRTYNGILYNSKEERDLAKKLDDEKIEHLNKLVNQVDMNNNEEIQLIIKKIEMLEYSPSIVNPYLDILLQRLGENEEKEFFETFNELFNEAFNNMDELFNLKNVVLSIDNKELISKAHNKINNRINELKRELELDAKFDEGYKYEFIRYTLKTMTSCCICLILGIVLYRFRVSLLIQIFYRFSWWKLILILLVIGVPLINTFNNILDLLVAYCDYHIDRKQARIARKKLKEYNKKYDFNTYKIK